MKEGSLGVQMPSLVDGEPRWRGTQADVCHKGTNYPHFASSSLTLSGRQLSEKQPIHFFVARRPGKSFLCPPGEMCDSERPSSSVVCAETVHNHRPAFV